MNHIQIKKDSPWALIDSQSEPRYINECPFILKITAVTSTDENGRKP
jgi:hypothetical protein